MADEKDVVSKSGQLSDQNANLRQLIENATVWYSGGSLPLNFPSGNLGGPKDPGGPDASDLDPTVKANVLAEAFQSYSRIYTRVRKVRYRRIYQRSSQSGGTQIQINETEIAHLNDAYLQSSFYADINDTATDEGIEPKKLIDDDNFNSFISSLYSKWLLSKENRVNFDFVFCHSSCHSSCHSAGRTRR